MSLQDSPLVILKREPGNSENHGPFHSSVSDPIGTPIFPASIPDFEFVFLASKYYYIKFPQFVPASKTGKKRIINPGFNLHQAQKIKKHMSATFDLYWLITDIIGFEFSQKDYKRFWSSVHASQGDALAWQSGSFAILDIACHNWNKTSVVQNVNDEDEPVDPRMPVLYTNNNGFYQQCALPFSFLDFILRCEGSIVDTMESEGELIEQLSHSNNSLFKIDTNNIENAETLDSGAFLDDEDSDPILNCMRRSFHQKLVKAASFKKFDTEYNIDGGEHNISLSFTKLFEFYPTSSVVYSGQSLLVFEHFQDDKKMGEVTLSKEMFKCLMAEYAEIKEFEELELTTDRKHTHYIQKIFLQDRVYSKSRALRLEGHCNSSSINKKFYGKHPYLDRYLLSSSSDSEFDPEPDPIDNFWQDDSD